MRVLYVCTPMRWISRRVETIPVPHVATCRAPDQLNLKKGWNVNDILQSLYSEPLRRRVESQEGLKQLQAHQTLQESYCAVLNLKKGWNISLVPVTPPATNSNGLNLKKGWNLVDIYRHFPLPKLNHGWISRRVETGLSLWSLYPRRRQARWISRRVETSQWPAKLKNKYNNTGWISRRVETM